MTGHDGSLTDPNAFQDRRSLPNPRMIFDPEGLDVFRLERLILHPRDGIQEMIVFSRNEGAIHDQDMAADIHLRWNNRHMYRLHGSASRYNHARNSDSHRLILAMKLSSICTTLPLASVPGDHLSPG
jgi:hypothetical protein